MRQYILLIIILFSFNLPTKEGGTPNSLTHQGDSSLSLQAMELHYETDSLFVELETKLLTEYELQPKDSVDQIRATDIHLLP